MTDVELDFEVDQDDYGLYCAICSECFDEDKEFIDHIACVEHSVAVKNKMNSLKDNDAYCSLCLVKINENDTHHFTSSASDHKQFYDSRKRTCPDSVEPTVEIYSAKKEAAKSKKGPKGSLRDRVMAKKCIGVGHIRRAKANDMWFCGLCLEKFSDPPVDEHCTRAQHAIQCLKLYDSETAYQLKQYANDKKNKQKFNALVLLKAKDIFDIEKDTPEFLRFMLELERYEKVVVKAESSKVVMIGETTKTKELCNINTEKESQAHLSTSQTSPPEEADLLLEADDSILEDGDSLLQEGVSPDPIEMVSLFEEGDRDVIPDVEDSPLPESQNKVPKRNVITTKNVRNASPAYDSTLLIGLPHLIQLKNQCYRCSLCNITYKKNLSSCRNHMASSLHRRNMLNLSFKQPVPLYLEKLREKNAVFYNRIIRIEAQKIEHKERQNETREMTIMRAGILRTSIQELPASYHTEKGLSENDKKLDLVKLAKDWDAENTKDMFDAKLNVSDNNAGANTSVLSPLQPNKDNLLVGINTVTFLSGLTFNCKLCNVKFTLQTKRKMKSHVTGRLHKQKALINAYGNNVDAYLKHRATNEGYDVVTRMIIQSCILLEKEEIESESQETRLIRSRLLGVKVDQLPLPLITMSNETPFDLKQAVADWKSGKKIVPYPKKAKEEPAKEIKVAEKDKKIITSHADSQDFSPKMTAPKDIIIQVKNDKAKNIFDLCKPLPASSPEPVTFPAKKSPHVTCTSSPGIKNIDIDSLRKSLNIDADFIPVKKASPKAEESSKSSENKNQQNISPPDKKSEVSVKAAVDKVAKPRDNKPQPSTSVPKDIKQASDNKSKDNRSISKDNDNARKPDLRNKLNPGRQLAKENPRNLQDNRQSNTNTPDKNEKQHQRVENAYNAGRDQCIRENNNLRRGTSNQGRGTNNRGGNVNRQNNQRWEKDGNEPSPSRNFNRGNNPQQRGNSNNRSVQRDFSRDRSTEENPRRDFNRGNTSHQMGGNNDRPIQKDFNRSASSEQNPRNNFNRGNNNRPQQNDFNRGNEPNQRSDFNRGNNSNMIGGPNDRPIQRDFHRSNEQNPRMDLNRGNNPQQMGGPNHQPIQGNNYQNCGQNQQYNQPQGARNFDIDMNSMKNTNLSNALAKVINLGSLQGMPQEGQNNPSQGYNNDNNYQGSANPNNNYQGNAWNNNPNPGPNNYGNNNYNNNYSGNSLGGAKQEPRESYNQRGPNNNYQNDYGKDYNRQGNNFNNNNNNAGNQGNQNTNWQQQQPPNNNQQHSIPQDNYPQRGNNQHSSFSQPNNNQQQRNTFNQAPRHENQAPHHDNQGPRHDNQGPRHDNQGPRHDNQGPRHDNQGPRHNNQGPRHDNDMGYQTGTKRGVQPQYNNNKRFRSQYN